MPDREALPREDCDFRLVERGAQLSDAT